MKFRHLLGRTETLTGYGPVGPHEVIHTDLDLSSSPNFERLDIPTFASPATEAAPVVDTPVVIIKNKKEQPVEETDVLTPEG